MSEQNYDILQNEAIALRRDHKRHLKTFHERTQVKEQVAMATNTFIFCVFANSFLPT